MSSFDYNRLFKAGKESKDFFYLNFMHKGGLNAECLTTKICGWSSKMVFLSEFRLTQETMMCGHSSDRHGYYGVSPNV